jgi:hypothetical protein
MRITSAETAADLLRPGTMLAHMLEDMRGRCSEAAQRTAPASMTQPRPFKPIQNTRQNMATKQELNAVYGSTEVTLVEKPGKVMWTTRGKHLDVASAPPRTRATGQAVHARSLVECLCGRTPLRGHR